MAARSRRRDHPRLLNPDGQQLLENAFRYRSRAPRADFKDIADGYLQALRDHGLLDNYLIPGIDPFEVLAKMADA